MLEFSELREQLATYLPQDQVAEITSAFLMAKEAHKHQSRKSGEPYIIHPLAVCKILCNMKMDYQSIVAAMLHDVIEDTDTSKEDINLKFGEKVAELVDGVSKLTKIPFDSTEQAQAENLRKMILAMSKDIRVILIKLADRLHNLQTLSALPVEKQRRKAKETLEIYAPIASRLGMHHFKLEFEDLGFQYLHPYQHEVLSKKVKKYRGNRKEIITDLKRQLQEKIEKSNIQLHEVLGREKHLYSLYQKMNKKDLELDEVMDVYALRLIVETTDECYRVLGIVHNLFKPVHGKFKDYIAVPKANSYQSLHSIILGPTGLPVEIQIRTKEMNDIAENGIAAHWAYKANTNNDNDYTDNKTKEWIKNLLSIHRDTGTSLEFMENIKVDLYSEEVYVFTPMGDIMALPNNATVVDFAYAVHTGVGNSCIAAKIDRRLVPLSTSLSSGQTVEIITADSAHPNPIWLSFVVTGKARSNIRCWLKNQKSNEAKQLGKRLFERSLSTHSLTIEDIPQDTLDNIFMNLQVDSMETLYKEIGLGNRLAPLVAKRFAAEISGDNTPSNSIFTIKGTEGMVINYAKCCRPIPDDKIIGALSVGKGIEIHKENCKKIKDVKDKPEKYIHVEWHSEIQAEFKTELKIQTINQKGALASIASILSENEASIENVRIDENDNKHIDITFLLYIKNRTHLARIIKKTRELDIVQKVNRI